MDELLIDEKRYISSKQAAKVTGYAKDYIGQLCREGRVPARLVGRSWYVLESALQDHRFGAPKSTEAVPAEKPSTIKKPPTFAQTWEAPRYEASTEATLPQIHRAQEEQAEPVAAETEGQASAAQYLQDSWRSWFEHIAQEPEPVPTLKKELPEKEKDHPQEEEKEVLKEEEIPIQIHTMYELPPENLLPRHPFVAAEEPEIQEQRYSEPLKEHSKARTTLLLSVFNFTFVFIALASAFTAVIGSGLLDSFVVSYRQADFITGSVLYIK